MASFGTNDVIQYYLYLTFNAGAENTYLYGGDGGSGTTSSQSTAATSPFTLRNRPASLAMPCGGAAALPIFRPSPPLITRSVPGTAATTRRSSPSTTPAHPTPSSASPWALTATLPSPSTASTPITPPHTFSWMRLPATRSR